MRFFSPLNSVGSCSSRRFRLAFLCRNWWLLCDFRRVIFPVPVILNRFAAVLLVLIFGMLLSADIGLRQQDHDHELSVQDRYPLRRREIFDLVQELVELLPSEFRVGDFASLKLAGDLNLVPFLEEPNGIPDKKRHVVIRDSRADLYTFKLLLFALLILAELALKVLKLSVVDDLANGRLGSGGNNHEVQPFVPCDLERLPALHDSKLVTFGSDDADVSVFEHPLVYLRARFGTGRSMKSRYVGSPLGSPGWRLALSISRLILTVNPDESFASPAMLGTYAPYGVKIDQARKA